jgi:hypothetical protein
MAEPYPMLLSKVAAAEACVLQWIRDFHEIQPRGVFEEEVQAIKAKIQHERDRMLATHSHVEKGAALDKAIQYEDKVAEEATPRAGPVAPEATSWPAALKHPRLKRPDFAPSNPSSRICSRWYPKFSN